MVKFSIIQHRGSQKMSTPRLSFGNAKLDSKFCEDRSETFQFMKTIFLETY